MNRYGVDPDALIRLLMAVALGALVGLERELSGQTAGLRTHIAVCLGACLFGVISTLGFSEFQNIDTNVFRADVTRVASNVVVGVGFLGAGMIMRRPGGVANLTTAASVWTVAAVGLTAGVGDLGIASVAAVITIGYLAALRPLRRWIERSAARAHETLAVTLADGALPEDLISRLDGRDGDGDGVRIRLVSVEKENGRLVAIVNISGRPERAVCTVTERLALEGDVTDLARR